MIPKIIFKGDKLLLIDAPTYYAIYKDGTEELESKEYHDQVYNEELDKATTWEIKNADADLWQHLFEQEANGDTNWQPEQGKLYDIPAGYSYKLELACQSKIDGNKMCTNSECDYHLTGPWKKCDEFAIITPYENEKMGSS